MPSPLSPSRTRYTKILAVILGVFLVVAIFGPSFARPEKAQAFPGEAMAAAVWKWYKENIEKRINKVTKGAADLAFKNALKVYLTKLAEDTAVWVASAGTGQKPLFLTDPNYFNNLTDAAAGDFIDTLATKTLGVDVCKPADPQKQFTLQTGLAALINPTNLCQSQCKRNNTNALKDVESAMQIGAAEFEQVQQLPLPVAEGVLADLQQSLNTIPDCKEFPLDVVACAVPAGLTGYCNFKGGDVNSSLGNCIQVYERDIAAYKQTVSSDYQTCLNLCSAQKRVARCTASEAFDNYQSLTSKEFTTQVSLYFDFGQNDIGNLIKLREQADDVKAKALEAYKVSKEGIQAVVNPTTKEVKTPASLTEEAAKQGTTKDPSGSVFSIQTGSPIADAIGVFTNTLTKRLLQRIFEKGFNPSTEPTNITIGGTFISKGAQAARALFASLAKPDFTAGGSGAALADLAACPDANPGPDNCVIDEGFRHAIEQEMTVQEAVDGGFLDRNKPFGFRSAGPGANDDVEPDSRNGYPLRSMLILRRLRILPVGWEIAAQYVRDFGTSGYTLGDVLDGYGQCAEGAASPFCGLVDPNWVLTSPETFCAVSGATAALTSREFTPDPLYPDAPQIRQVGRVESCVDERTCLQKNDDGSCAQYGYCVKERPSWKFGGDTCPASARSCDTFATPAGTQLTVLANSVDAEQCTAENAGCQWYCQDINAASGAFTCTGASTDENKRYFTDDVKSCPPDAEGCTEYVRTVEHSNLTVNGSFETLREAGSYCSGNSDVRCNPGSCVLNGNDYGSCVQTSTANVIGDGQQDDILGWQENGVTAQLVSGANSGASAALLEGSGEFASTFTSGVPLTGQTYTLSFFATTDDLNCGVQFGVRANVEGSSQQFQNSADASLTTGWQRFTLTTTFDPNITFADTAMTTFFTPRTCTSATITIDDVLLEAGASFSDYREYGSENKIFLNNKRLSCRAEEVGCTLYTSATDTIPAVATAADACAADKVGCRAFLEVPVTMNGANPDHPVRTGKRCSIDQSVSCAADSDCIVTVNGEETNLGACVASVSLTPSTGTLCSAADVGCEEYTNLDVVAQGGEGKENYTTIRPCAKPTGDEQNEKTFYTWLGSEQTGYQLKAYVLKPTTALIADDTVPNGPEYIDGQLDIGATMCTKAIYSNPNDPNWSPDCREFYDASLNTYYRLYARTVTVSEDCHPLRNTIDGVVYNAIPSEGTTCPASAVQCREYRGPSGYNTRTLLSDNFDDGDTLGWSGGVADNTSLNFGGISMRVAAGSAVQTDSIMNVPSQLEQGTSYLVTFWAGAAANTPTTLVGSFAGDTQAFPGEAKLKWDAAIGAPQWNVYTVGPFHLDRAVDTDDADGDQADHLKFSSLEGQGFYLDNIVLTEVTDNVYLIKGTYDLCTGSENCSQYTTSTGDTAYLKSFTRLCSEDKVGCEALINTYNSDSPFGSVYENGTASTGTEAKTVPPDGIEFFVNSPDAYCSSEYQGCTLLGKPTLGPSGATCSNDPTKRCITAADCGEGATCDVRDSTIQKFDSVYLVDDPDTYGTTLCRASETGCDAWTNARANTVSYFRHPEPFTCEYRTVTIGNESFTGWYKTGTSGLLASDACPTASPAPAKTCSVTTSRTCSVNSDCPSGETCRYATAVTPAIPYTQPTGLCPDATTQCTVDADCTGIGSGACTRWAGICSTEQAGCKEYRDESEPANCYSQCLLTVDSTTGFNIPVDADCRLDPNAKCSTDASKTCMSDADCPNGGTCGATGCRGYWYLESTVADNASECNGVPNDELGCKAFYSPDGVTQMTQQ